ncbi:SAM-dependent methyltransferase [Spirulina sp. 06S082]|uniref:SAM-dependent methyltransferase n=1 Tax=Spirulina sp. 06S082 TaxID=3110248 RepID=UPI002B1EECBF|nr:SAM-dependent methyltransferase [Spirulina sp. 06S082]MEA5470095.1 SAM-dependent methyltransferase [Spirulina sp. 06S082]
MEETSKNISSKLIPQAFIPFSARLMAALRAKETVRKDRLFSDPFAAQLAGEDAFNFANTKSLPRDIAYLAIRTKLFDDFFQEAMTNISQVVILAAGMDTRAYRLSWPENTCLYELDFSGILEYKENIIGRVSPNCQRIAIAADLTQPWTHLLLEQGYQRDRPSIWLLEGLLMYLEASQCDRLMQDVFALTAPRSQLGLDLIDRQAVDGEPYNGYFRFGVDDPEEFLKQYGWTAQIIDPAELAVRFGCFENVLLPHNSSNSARAFLVKAHNFDPPQPP